MLRRFILVLAAACAIGAGSAMAQEEAHHPEDHRYSFDSPFGTYDMGEVQRGFLVYKQVCSSCHSMDHLAYRHLGEAGGPFAAYRVRNHETGDYEVQIGPPAHGGQLLDISDNPYVRSIAAEVQVADIDRETGLAIERTGRPSDHFRRPFANEYAARAANGGAMPPDLSVIAAARHNGSDYVRSLLLGYTGEDVDGKHVNRYFPGGLIGMAPPLAADIVTYDDGTPATVEQMATDVAAFLTWATDPHADARKSLGLQVLLYLLILSVLLYAAYKAVWRDQKH
jgi:ubiquinol-cytochrome c reductase cytochrome c1 subunit